MEPVKIVKQEFTADVNAGMTREQLKEKYGVSLVTIKRIANELGLTIKKNFKPKFELVDAEEEVAQMPEPTVEQSLNA